MMVRDEGREDFKVGIQKITESRENDLEINRSTDRTILKKTFELFMPVQFYFETITLVVNWVPYDQKNF